MKHYILGLIYLLSAGITQVHASTEGVISWKVSSDFQNNQQPLLKSRAIQTEEEQALAYLNTLRAGTGLISYTLNSQLNEASQNHANYLLTNNTFSHYEDLNNADATGVQPADRGTYVGYNWTSYSENISAGDDSVISSIDGLFTAIYHRLGFLSFDTEDLGVGYFYNSDYAYNSAHVFNMGIQSPRTTSDTRTANPTMIKWPYPGYTDMQPAFFNNEFPDPLPECNQNGPSGNPISIQFNPDKSGDITASSFTLQDEEGSTISTKAITENLTDKQFVLFPIERLDWDQNYTATFTYTEDGSSKSETWSFKTRALAHPILKLTDTATTYEVSKNSTYAFFVVPDDCNDSSTYYSSYSPSHLEMIGNFIDANTHYVKIIADVGTNTSLSIGNGKTFNFHVFTEEVSNLTFTNISSTSVTLNWDHNTGGEDGFKIYRNGKLIATIDNSSTTYHDSGLSPLTTYTYTVKATKN